MQDASAPLNTSAEPNPRDRERTSEARLTQEPGTQVLNSQDLLRGHKTVSIEHNGERYRLQHTRAGKLILTK
jgi:hemin uptake protein HemP